MGEEKSKYSFGHEDRTQKLCATPSRLNVALLHLEWCQAATSFLGLKMLLIAKAFSPDRIFADHRYLAPKPFGENWTKNGRD